MVSRETQLKRYKVKHSESVGGGNLSPRRLPGLSGSSVQLTFVTFRAANIRPYGLARTIQPTLNKNPTAVALFSQAYGLPASPRETFGGNRSLPLFNEPLCSATLRVGRLPPPTNSEDFSGFRSTGSSRPLPRGRLISAPTDWRAPFNLPLIKNVLR